MIRGRELYGRVVLQLLVHVDQRRRRADAMRHAEAQPVRLAVVMIPGSEASLKHRSGRCAGEGSYGSCPTMTARTSGSGVRCKAANTLAGGGKIILPEDC